MSEVVLMPNPAPVALAAGRARRARVPPLACPQRPACAAPLPQHVDAVTGLLNRGGIVAAVTALLEAASARRSVGALLCVDLGGPDVLEALAERGCAETRDALLREVAEALREAVRGADAVGRLGGDDFVVVLEGLGDLGNASRIAEAVMCALRRLAVTDGVEALSPRIGVTRLPPSPRAAASMFAARAEAVDTP